MSSPCGVVGRRGGVINGVQVGLWRGLGGVVEVSSEEKYCGGLLVGY